MSLAQKEDYDNKPKKASKKKRVEFDQSIYFDDGTSMSATQRKSTFKRRSLSALLGRKMVEQTPEQPTRDIRAEMGVLRIFADITEEDNLVNTLCHVKMPLCLAKILVSPVPVA